MGEDGRGMCLAFRVRVFPFWRDGCAARSLGLHIVFVFEQEYRAGRLLTGQLKKKCIEVLQAFVKNFQDVSRFFLVLFCLSVRICSLVRVCFTDDGGCVGVIGKGKGHR